MPAGVLTVCAIKPTIASVIGTDSSGSFTRHS